MKPNYKAAAKQYRDKLKEAEEKIRILRFFKRKASAIMAEQDREIAKLKAQYSDALACIAELQEDVLMKEEKADA